MQPALSNLASLSYLTPEWVLAGAAIVLFAASAATRGGAPGWGRWLFPSLALAALGAAGGWLVWFGLTSACPGGLFGGLLACDPWSVFFRALTTCATLVAVLLSLGSPSLPAERRGEYHGLLLVLAAGLGLLSAADNLLMLYVALESVSLISYLLTGWDARRSRSTEAGLKYVLYGGVASGILLFGLSLLFGLFGDLSFAGLQRAVAEGAALQSGAGRWTAMLAVTFVLTGLGFKVAAVPFHMWCPDVYEGAPTPFTALLSVAPKAAGFAAILRFTWGLFAAPDQTTHLPLDLPWPVILGLLSALTMTLGNLAAIVQDNLKRLLAYSSIAHAGYVLLGATAGGPDGFEAVALYMSVYLLMNFGAFAVVSAVDRSTGSEHLTAYRGLGRRAPLLALAMAVFLLSLTGLPPTAGFIGKLYLFAALIARGGPWYIALALLGILNAVVSLYYYARVLKVMYLEAPSPDAAPVSCGNPAGALAGLLAVPTLVLGIFWQPLAVLSTWASHLAL